MDCSTPDSSARGISQARILEQVAISYSSGSSQPRDRTPVSCVSCIGRRTPYPFEPSRPTSCPSGADPDHSLPPHPTRGTSELRVRAQQERTQEKQQPPLLGPSPASAGFNNCPPQRSGDMINSDSRIIKMLPPSIWH